MTVYADTDFDISEMEVVWKKHCRCKLTPTEGTIFHNLLKAGGWVRVDDLPVTLKGEKLRLNDWPNVLAVHIGHIRMKLKACDLPIIIENQRRSYWMDGAYRLTYEKD